MAQAILVLLAWLAFVLSFAVALLCMMTGDILHVLFFLILGCGSAWAAVYSLKA